MKGNPRYPISKMIEYVNDSDLPVVSLDLSHTLHI